MIELTPNLIPFLIVDLLNPVLFALLVVAVGTARPLANSTAFLAGHTLLYFISGGIIALGLDRITDRLESTARRFRDRAFARSVLPVGSTLLA